MDTSRLLEEGRRFLDGGDIARAKETFLKLLLHDRHHHDGMLGLAEVFVAADDYASARVVLAEAVTRHPASSRAYSALGGALLELDDLRGAHDAFVASLRIDPAHRKAWAGLGVAFERTGDLAAADRAWREAFRDGGPAISTYRGKGEPVRVLLLRSAVDGNIPLKAVLDDRIFQWITLFVESFDEGMILPPHAVVFNAVGNADLRTRALDKAQAVLRATAAPVINHPAAVRHTGRVQIAERLRDIPGVLVPRMHTLDRDRLEGDLGLGWPVLLRSPGFHTGEHFVKVDTQAHLPDAIAGLPGDPLLVIEYLDTRSDAGAFRKYRALTIDGGLYPLHLAMSRDWKVHYFSADQSAEFRAHEQAFLENPESAIGPGAVAALQRAARALAFDYGGIDFAVDRDERLVIFEANPTMVIVPPAQSPDQAVRRHAADRAIAATRAMIVSRANRIAP
ncbi:MAG TPA: tetratricopeptide repeat protein [Verrucomicrobiae bacterium]|nr:tetratricopeptide repeat protein [Verrucomicrobiae bacterium]